MSVDTKGVIVFTKKATKDPFEVSNLVIKALQQSQLTLKMPRSPFVQGRTIVKAELRPGSHSIAFSFQEADEKKRVLQAFF